MAKLDASINGSWSLLCRVLLQAKMFWNGNFHFFSFFFSNNSANKREHGDTEEQWPKNNWKKILLDPENRQKAASYWGQMI